MTILKQFVALKLRVCLPSFTAVVLKLFGDKTYFQNCKKNPSPRYIDNLVENIQLSFKSYFSHFWGITRGLRTIALLDNSSAPNAISGPGSEDRASRKKLPGHFLWKKRRSRKILLKHLRQSLRSGLHFRGREEKLGQFTCVKWLEQIFGNMQLHTERTARVFFL